MYYFFRWKKKKPTMSYNSLSTPHWHLNFSSRYFKLKLELSKNVQCLALLWKVKNSVPYYQAHNPSMVPNTGAPTSHIPGLFLTTHYVLVNVPLCFCFSVCLVDWLTYPLSLRCPMTKDLIVPVLSLVYIP